MRELYLTRCESLVALFSENLKFGVDFLVNLLRDYSHKGEREEKRYEV